MSKFNENKLKVGDKVLVLGNVRPCPSFGYSPLMDYYIGKDYIVTKIKFGDIDQYFLNILPEDHSPESNYYNWVWYEKWLKKINE